MEGATVYFSSPGNEEQQPVSSGHQGMLGQYPPHPLQPLSIAFHFSLYIYFTQQAPSTSLCLHQSMFPSVYAAVSKREAGAKRNRREQNRQRIWMGERERAASELSPCSSIRSIHPTGPSPLHNLKRPRSPLNNHPRGRPRDVVHSKGRERARIVARLSEVRRGKGRNRKRVAIEGSNERWEK